MIIYLFNPFKKKNNLGLKFFIDPLKYLRILPFFFNILDLTYSRGIFVGYIIIFWFKPVIYSVLGVFYHFSFGICMVLITCIFKVYSRFSRYGLSVFKLIFKGYFLTYNPKSPFEFLLKFTWGFNLVYRKLYDSTLLNCTP